MAQSPITVIDGTETAAVARVEINGALEALATLSSGATAPSTTFSGMFWHDTSTGILKVRSEADDAWINVGYLDQSTNEFKPYVGSTQVDTQATSVWEAGTGTTEGIVSPAKVKAAITSLAESPVKAWVNFDGTGTVSIRESFNVSSVTDNGTGNYTVNFTTALVDANYAVVMGQGELTTQTDRVEATISQSSSSVQVISREATGKDLYDAQMFSVAVLR